MARTALTPYAPLGPFPTLPIAANGLNSAPVAADVANGNQFATRGRELIIAFNSDASPHTITISSVVDPQNRTGDITTYSIGAGLYSYFLVTTNQAGWRQSDGNVYLSASDATVKFTIISLPSIN